MKLLGPNSTNIFIFEKGHCYDLYEVKYVQMADRVNKLYVLY